MSSDSICCSVMGSSDKGHQEQGSDTATPS
jgi:hypothetical protein